MSNKRQSARDRYHSPRERFVSVMRGGSLTVEPTVPWFRRREIYLPLIMVFLFFALAFVVKIMVQVQNQAGSSEGNPPTISQPEPEKESNEGETMNYEEAKRIFGGQHP